MPHSTSGPIFAKPSIIKLPIRPGPATDGVFFLDLPGQSEKTGRLEAQNRDVRDRPKPASPKNSQLTAVEIRACCRLAALLNLLLIQAAQNVVPVAVTAAEASDVSQPNGSIRCVYDE